MTSNGGVTSRPSSSGLFSSRRLYFIMAILVPLIVADISLVRVYDVISKQFVSYDTKEILFGIISISILVAQFVLLRFVRPSTTLTQKSDKLRVKQIYFVIRIVQYILAVIVVILIFQTILQSYYSTFNLLLVIVTSYSISVGILSAFIARMSSWVSFKKSSVPLVVFIIALGSVTVNAIIGMVDVSLRLGDRPQETRPTLVGSMDVSKGRFNLLDNLYFLTYLFSFISAWFASATILNHYVYRLGKIKYWLIMVTPLIFFMAQFTPFLTSLVSPALSLDSFTVARWSTLIVTMSKPIAGLMLGLQFWAIAMVTAKNNPIRIYFVISGFGFLLLFTSNQAILMSITPYPPFGLATITVMGVSSYLVLIGVYTSSLSISRDLQLRKSIRRFAMTEAKLLSSIALAENEKEIESKVKEIITVQSSQIEQETGVPSWIDDAEMAEYVRVVQKEIKKGLDTRGTRQ